MIKHNDSKRVILGLVVIAAGALLLLHNFGIYNDFLSKYIFRWETVLIAIGLVSVVHSRGNGPGFIILFLGVYFFLKNRLDIPFLENINFWQLFLAILFIVAGVFLLFKRKGIRECHRLGNTVSDMDTIDEVAVFGGGDRTIVSNNFKGGKLLCVFGGSNFYMSRCKLAPGKNYIDVLAIFGGFKLVVPEEWNVKISTISIFGGISDKHRILTPNDSTEGGSELIIKGFVVFGGGEIKSF
jgi:predicted membrane protein